MCSLHRVYALPMLRIMCAHKEGCWALTQLLFVSKLTCVNAQGTAVAEHTLCLTSVAPSTWDRACTEMFSMPQQADTALLLTRWCT